MQARTSIESIEIVRVLIKLAHSGGRCLLDFARCKIVPGRLSRQLSPNSENAIKRAALDHGWRTAVQPRFWQTTAQEPKR
jgi:hypothetical protein